MTTFADQLHAAVKRCHNAVLVGLDPRADMLPLGLRPKKSTGSLEEIAAAYEKFCCEVIDVVAPLVPAAKPQAAFFEQLGPAGMVALERTVRYAQSRGLLVIIDGKRNDIGTTATAYAEGFLGRLSPWGGDALTVSPYLGDDSLTPFVDVARQRDAGIFVLVKTSNPGGKMLQDLVVNEPTRSRPIYRYVADYVERLAYETAGACGYGAVGAVVGATYPEQLAELRQAMPHTWFLVPGYGSQGGTATDVAPAFDSQGQGAIVNNSRGIIFAYSSKQYARRFADSEWQRAVEAATRDMIEQLAEAVGGIRD